MYGIVMAGGLSSRMGRNKLRLSIHGDGKDMLERTVELLGGFTDDVFVSCRAPEDAAPFKAIPDEVDRQGPFGGVYSALRRLQSPYWSSPAICRSWTARRFAACSMRGKPVCPAPS